MSKNYQVVFAAQRKVELQECEMPVVGDDDLLLETEVSQISIGTELTMLEGNVDPDSSWASSISYPAVAGYSNVGKIIAVGKNVSKDLIGKRMLTAAPHKRYYTVPNPATVYYQAAFVPDGVKSEEAVFGILAVVSMASVRFSAIKPGDACVVYGAGLVGQLAARLAKCAGATKVFVCDVADSRLDKLPDDPCFIKINTTKEKAVDVVMANTTNNEGAAIVFETTSVPSLIEEELACLMKGGKLVITSSPKGKSLIDLNYVSGKGIAILGAHNMTVHPWHEEIGNPWTRKRDTEYFMELLDKKQTTTAEMVTHTYNYKNVVDAYEMLMKDRTQALSVNITWED